MVKQASVKRKTSSYSLNWKKELVLIMFSKRLRHRQAKTRIYVADLFCLSTKFLSTLGGISLSRFENFPEEKCSLSFQNFQMEVYICWGFKGFSWGLSSCSKLPDPGHIWVTACIHIWRMVCMVLSKFQQVSVKLYKIYSSILTLRAKVE